MTGNSRRKPGETEEEYKLRRRQYSKEYYHANRDAIIEYQRQQRLNIPLEKWTEWSRKSRHGMSKQQFEDMLADQDGKCSICLDPIGVVVGTRKKEGQACVDHCHLTGKIRGLLCTRCNTGIGHLRDSVDNVTRALEYLKRHKE